MAYFRWFKYRRKWMASNKIEIIQNERPSDIGRKIQHLKILEKRSGIKDPNIKLLEKKLRGFK